jgi:hypothetical protein
VPDLNVIVQLPAPFAVTLPALVIVATFLLLLVQVYELAPVALNVPVFPTANVIVLLFKVMLPIPVCVKFLSTPEASERVDAV